MSRAHRESQGLQIAAADQGDRKGRDRLGDHVFRPSVGGVIPRRRRAFLVQLTIGSLVYLTSIVTLDVLHSGQWLVRHLTLWLVQWGMLS
jgi:hypothetical protein